MRTICFYFQVHQPYRLRRYRFFDIGRRHDYFDGEANQGIIRKVAQKCYLPMNGVLEELIGRHGDRFRVAFSISGAALDQLEAYCPEVLESFQRLAATGCVELLAETYAHSLAALTHEEEFRAQVEMHHRRIGELFGQQPTTFRNTELVYSDRIGHMVAQMGYTQMLTEGAKHILAWKSPNYLYHNAMSPRLKLLLKNFRLSDDIAFRFSNRGWDGWPLTAEKFAHWLGALPRQDEVVNLFMDYETFGEHQWADTGIFDFMRALPEAVFQNGQYEFLTPRQVAQKHQSVGPLHVEYPISWADEERDLTAWLGNELQDEAFSNLYGLRQRVLQSGDQDLRRSWLLLQTSDHFYYMCTKWFADGDVHRYFNPYGSPYEAFVNYMNVLSDFTLELERRLAQAGQHAQPDGKRC
ncbi:MAG: alpha-amylase [Bacteroidia bacterium]|nr:MAG: alpha-amylase [Bacteroidia bacterium]